MTGQDITNYSIPAIEIPTSAGWIDFNIPDISVSVDETYYMICKTDSGNQFNSYNWYEGYGDLYDRGTKYYSNDSGIIWYQNADYDFCFKTFGKKAELEITYIKGGTSQLIYGITNIGTSDTTDLKIDITLSGGVTSPRHK